MVVSKVELLEEPSNKLAEDDASLGRVVRDIAGVLDKLGKVDLVEREASNLGDDLRALRVSRGGRQSKILSTWGRAAPTEHTIRWTITKPAPITSPKGTIAYLSPVL